MQIEIPKHQEFVGRIHIADGLFQLREGVGCHFIVNVEDVELVMERVVGKFQSDNVGADERYAPCAWVDPLVDIETDSCVVVFHVG